MGKLDLRALPFNGRIVNNQKVKDHHAIIPTGAATGSLRDRERKVYVAIVRDENLKSPELTGEWESKLKQFEAGQAAEAQARMPLPRHSRT